MNTIEWSDMNVMEMAACDAANANGGLIVAPTTSAWWTLFVNYVEYCMQTGGANVTYHAQ